MKNNTQRLCVASVLLGHWLSTQVAYASDAGAESPAVRTLDEVVVSASKEGTPLRDTPATVHTIDAETLEQERPVFFGDVVNRIPGVTVNNLGAEQHMASFRQPISTQGVYLYLEDGIPLRPAGLFNHNQVYELNMAGIGDIEIIKGPASSLYGSYATGGLMNFMTRAPSREQTGAIAAQVSDRGYRRLDVDLSGTMTERHGLRFSAYTFKQTDGFAQHSDAEKTAFTLRHDFRIDGETRLKTVLTHSDLFTETGGTINQAQFNAGQIGVTPQTFTNRDVKATRLNTVFERAIGEQGLTTAALFYRDNTTNQIPTFFQTTDVRMNVPNPSAGANATRPNVNQCTRDASGAPPIAGVSGEDAAQNGSAGSGTRCGRTSDVAFDSLGMEVRHRQRFGAGRSRWIAGLTYDQGRLNSLEQRYTFNYTPAGPFTDFSGPLDRYRDYAVRFETIGLYGQVEWALGEQWMAVAGVRQDRVHYDYRNDNGLGVSGAQIGVPSQQNTYEATSPKLGLVFNPAPRVNLYANVSTGFAPPEISSKYGGSSLGQIDRSRSRTVEVGARLAQLPLRTAVDLALYTLKLDDGTYTNESSQNYNADSRHAGVEVGVVTHGLPDATLGISLALTEQTVTSVPRNNANVTTSRAGKSLRFAPEQVVTVFAAYALSESTRVSGDIQMLSPYFTDEANTQAYGGHTVANVRLSHRMGPWEAWVAVRNLSDKRYAELVSTSFGRQNFNPGAPRTVLLGLRYAFGG